jgi:hypothetical protein
LTLAPHTFSVALVVSCVYSPLGFLLSSQMLYGRNSSGQAISLLNGHSPPNLQHSTSPNLQSSRLQHDVFDLLMASSTSPGRSQSSQSIPSSLLSMPHSPTSKEHDHPPGFIPLYFTNATTALPAKMDGQAIDASTNLPRTLGVMFYVIPS